MAAWAATTAYAEGVRVQPTAANGYNYRCKTAGTSGGTEPEWPTLLAAEVTDGTVVWQCVSAMGADIQKLAASAIIELFVLDSTAQGGIVSRFHCGTNELLASVTWQGDQYAPVPLKITGFEFSGGGKLPRPRMQIANTGGLISAMVLQYGDLLGAKLTRKRTLLKYLDAVNFTGGVNPDADPAAEFPDDVYFVDRKSTENKLMVEFELAPAFDVRGVKLPRRQIVQNVCPWVYRSAECSYAGGAVAKIDDTPTAVLGEDKCGKRLASCELRFGENAQLPYGGFPAAGLVR